MITLKTLRKLVDLQQFDQLKDNAQFLLEVNSENDQAWSLLALAYAHLGDRQAAEESCLRAEEALALGQLDASAQVDLAGVYCLFLRIDEAVSLLENALLTQADDGLALARLAWCRLYEGKLQYARTLYEKSIKLAPERLAVWSGLSRICLEQGDYIAAQQVLDQGIAQFSQVFEELPELVEQQFTTQFRALQLENWVLSGALADAEEWLVQRRETLPETEWAHLVVIYTRLLAGQTQHAVAEDALQQALKTYPENLTLIATLAELAQFMGRTQQAAQLYRLAIRLAEKNDLPVIGYWIQLSSTLLHLAEDKARKAAEKAVSLVGDLQVNETLSEAQIAHLALQAKSALAAVESQVQNFSTARELFQAVLETNPYFLPALQGLGQMEMQCGDLDAAIALFERVKLIDPAKGYSSLINARQFPEDELTLKRLEKAARQGSMEGKVRAGLLLQLASAWEKRKVFDTAFELAIEANQSSQAVLNYDAVAHRNSCARTRYAFSKPLYEHRKDYNIPSSLPVFVLGMPRSGTTLIEQIIAGHSEIFGAGELGVIPSRIQGLNRWERHVGSGRAYPDCVDDLSPEVRAGIADGILDELKALAEHDKPQAKHVVDKLPHNFENIGLIKFFFPNAKIISVRRDPRDIALSNYFTDYQAKHGGMGFAYDLTWIGEQLADHNLMMHHWQQTFPGEILEINYEDVVDNTEAMARRMLDYIGVEWEPEVLNFNKLDRPVKTASVWQVRQPIYKTAMAKWRNYEAYLAPLIQGTNAKILPDPITDIVTLPEPGLLQKGVALFNEVKLDEAEYEFKKLLHHIPEHAAANFMLGLVYIQKGHLNDAVKLMEKGYEACRWNQNWKKDLIQAYEIQGALEKAEALKNQYGNTCNNGHNNEWNNPYSHQNGLDEMDDEFNVHI